MTEQDRHNLFSELIARHQSELYVYIFAVVRNWEDADDLFQSVCVVLWRKFESYRSDGGFFAWARQTAKFEIRKFLDKRRPGFMSENLLDDIADTVARIQDDRADRHLAALEQCRSKLNNADEELLDLHYVEELGSRQIADRLQRSQPSVCNSLNRIRNWLLDCIHKELARQEHSDKRCS